MNDEPAEIMADLARALDARGKADPFAVAVRQGAQRILISASATKDLALKALRLCVEAEAVDTEAARLLLLVSAALYQPPLCRRSVQALSAG